MKPTNAAVLRLLRARGRDGLTEAEATDQLACRRLGARIFDLRTAGYVIESVPERTPIGARIARYVLVEPARMAPTTGVQDALL